DGFETWVDQERLLPGHDWNLEITKAVRNSDVVVVCLSNLSTVKVGYVQKELRSVLDLSDHQPAGGVFVIAVRLEPCEVPSRLVHWQYADLFVEHGYERLRAALRERSGAPSMPMAPLSVAPPPPGPRRKNTWLWIGAAITGAVLAAA